jgi:monoterpene epsilon-lactone hydrolase
MNDACHYEILIRGRLGPTMLEAFPSLAAQRRGEETLLSGALADQAALYGVLLQLEALGLQLLALNRSRLPESSKSSS